MRGFDGLRPIGAIQTAVLNRFRDVFGLEIHRIFQIGDGAGDFENAVVSAGAQALLRHGAFEQAFAVGGEFAEAANVAGVHLGVAVEFFAALCESFELLLARAHNALADFG